MTPHASNSHEYTLIFLHGLGDSGEGIQEWLNSAGNFLNENPKKSKFGLEMQHCKVILPTAK